ncbi:hypothetical protein K435DRAFT_883984 [Dendrothele bispora CBS 962.96]|uniref:K Homology domain-containing protein n=1 Tax=Dendrothele bispora (strain CBS 962.96) TaxID=1314807 RepID=A0A4S8M853_DENBC|nr:hypothetical protein K435DRAFT_883984 [Dendrothele bispora CBS 962.96]
MATPAVPPNLLAYCQLLHSELRRLHDRLDLLQFGKDASSTPTGHSWRLGAQPPLDFSTPGPSYSADTPAPTPTTHTIGHISVPLAQTHPTAEGKPDRYSCMLVVPDSVVGHLIGQGGKGLHQVHDISGARVQAFTLKSGQSGERHVAIRGTDTQIGEALVAFGRRIMRKRVRSKKKGSSHSSEGTTVPPLANPLVGVQSREGPTVVDVSNTAASRYVPPHNRSKHADGAAPKSELIVPQVKQPKQSQVHLPSSNATSLSLQSQPHTHTTSTQAMASPSPPISHSHTTPTAPSVAMGSLTPSVMMASASSSATPVTWSGSPMQIDVLSLLGGSRGGKQTARRSRPFIPRH